MLEYDDFSPLVFCERIITWNYEGATTDLRGAYDLAPGGNPLNEARNWAFPMIVIGVRDLEYYFCPRGNNAGIRAIMNGIIFYGHRNLLIGKIIKG